MIRKILIVDDHPLLRTGVKVLLSTYEGYEIAEANGGSEAIDLLYKMPVDLAILDIDMPNITGIDVARHIEANFAETKIVFLTSHADFYTFAEATEIAYSGFLFKENALEQLPECISSVFKGEAYVSSNCLTLINSNKERLKLLHQIRKGIASLTQTERKVLFLISEGKSTPQIANELFNSPKTIENHRTNICHKLELRGANNLLAFALEYKDLLEKIISY